MTSLRVLLLFSILGCAELITVSTPHPYINVTVGGSVLLQCSFLTDQQTSNLIIQWDFISPSSMTPQQIYYYQSGQVVVPKPYQSRLQLPPSPSTTSNASIIISDMQPSDSGLYTCTVHNFPDMSGTSLVHMIVNVLEKPSTPYCAVHGSVETGHQVTLTCHSERGSPAPKYTWTKLDQSKAGRPVLGTAFSTGVLQIRNISQFEFGEYQCNATNAVGFSTCTIDLTHEPGDGVIAGAVIGALLGCVLIILVVWFIAHSVKKHKYKSVKVSEGNEMKRQPRQAQEAADGVPMATAAGNLHAEIDEPKA